MSEKKLDEGKNSAEIVTSTDDPVDPAPFFQSWSNKLDEKKVLKTVSQLTSDFLEVSSHTQEIRYFRSKFISKKLIQTYLQVVISKTRNEAGVFLEKAEEFLVEYGEDLKEYFPGYAYLLWGIRLLNCGVKGQDKGQVMDRAYQKLTGKGRVAVLAVKQFFIGLVEEDSFQEQIGILREMIAADGENYEWHYRLHRALQVERRTNKGSAGSVYFQPPPPGVEEIDLIQKAYDLAPKNPDVILTYCHCLADFLRGLLLQTENGPPFGIINFGTKKQFSGVGHINGLLKQEAEKILLLDPICLKFSLGLGSIFTSGLPKAYRDIRFGKQCLDRALIFHSGNSRAIVRKGFYVLIIERDSDLAVGYFELANNINPGDFAALTALLYIYFQRRVVNEEMVGGILDKQLNKKTADADWDDKQRAELYFIKGLYAFLNSLEEPGLAWAKAFKIDREELQACFEKLPSLKKKYIWPVEYSTLISLPTFCSRLKLLIEKQAGSKVSLVVKKIRAQVKRAGRLEDEALKVRAKERENERQPQRRLGFVERMAMQDGNNGDKVQEACDIMGLKLNAPRDIVKDRYGTIVMDNHPVVHEELTEEEVDKKMGLFVNVHWALQQLL